MKAGRMNKIILLLFGVGLVFIIYGGYLLSNQMAFTIPGYSLFILMGIILMSVAFYLKGSS
jgi:uncharacterized membrane protein